MSEEYEEALDAAENQMASAVSLLIALVGIEDGRRIALGMMENALAIEHHRRYGKLEAMH
jgi:predicted methyltransferase MtxX (methanogen marker protein 4)